MSFLIDLINPAPQKDSSEDYKYQNLNSTYNSLSALTYVMNPSVVTNANFATLGIHGTTPITQADGDGAEFSHTWGVFGASNATYKITPTLYDSDSTIQSASDYYIDFEVSSFNGDDFYIYQRQIDTVRYYQKNNLTYGCWIYNNDSQTVKIRMDIFSYYNPTSVTQYSTVMYLQPGLNKFTSTILTDSLSGVSVGASPYTDFRLKFVDLIQPGGTASLQLYQIKCEFGTISTLLNQGA